MFWSPIEPPPAQPVGRRTRDDLNSVLKTAALIIAIAAGLVITLANYPAIIAGAKAIYNAMPPTSIKAR